MHNAAALFLALVLVFAGDSAAWSLSEASEIHAVDAHTFFEGRKVALHFDAAAVQECVLQQHRQSLLETCFENLEIKTIGSHRQNKLVSHMVSNRKTFEPFRNYLTGSVFYISWYPRVLMNARPAQQVSFTK